MFKDLDETIFVAGQITPKDVAAAAARGAVMVINNRPEGEAPGQPAGAAIAAAARAAGLAYRAIPITPGGFAPAQVDAMAAALAEAGGPVLAFCRSGTRSTLLWALARGRAGEDPAALSAIAAAAGYDLAPIRALIGRA